MDRIELCKSYTLGGLTPNTRVLTQLKERFEVPVYVMVRPCGGDFVYKMEEFKQMKTDMAELKEAGADGFVFGILTEEGHIDRRRNRALVNLAGRLPCTFHRAFGHIEDKE